MKNRQWVWDRPGSMIPTFEITKSLVEEILDVVDRLEEKIDRLEAKIDTLQKQLGNLEGGK